MNQENRNAVENKELTTKLKLLDDTLFSQTSSGLENPIEEN